MAQPVSVYASHGAELRHLRSSLTSLVSQNGNGLCCHRSAALVLDWPMSQLCCGELAGATAEELASNPNASATPFIHFWVEKGGFVYSPTRIEEERGYLIPWEAKAYHAIHGVLNAKHMPRPALLKLSGEIGLSPHLRLGRPLKTDESIAVIVLQAVGIPFAFAADGGLVPPEFAGR